MGAAFEPIVVRGSSALVLVAPHGGQRDYDRRPWGSAPLKVNDLHTASLTVELAEATGASAIVNARLDRNDADLNRVSAAHDLAPAFLERLGDLLSTTLAQHGHATVLTIHGWNVIQPAVDLGIGCASGAPVDRTAAVSPAFAAAAIPTLVIACAARGITASIGARYPARARENLVQLFTPRHRNDPRPLIRQLAALGRNADAVQLELGVPLRWPCSWRRRLVEACVAALPALLGTEDEPRGDVAPPAPPVAKERRHTLEIAGAETSGLMAMDQTGARLLLFPPDGSLALFTGERVGGEAPGHVGGLGVEPATGGALRIRFAGPMVHFPDTTPFLDLERGLGRGTVIERAEIALDFEPAHAGAGGSDFGTVRGTAMLDGRRLSLDGKGFSAAGGGPALWPRVRASLDLGDGDRLSLTVGLDGGACSGFLSRDGQRLPVTGAAAHLGGGDDPLRGLILEVQAEGARGLQLHPQAVHTLPVIRGGAPAPLRLVYACCTLSPGAELAGWCEIGGF